MLVSRDRIPIRILNVTRFPIGGIRSYLRYTYGKLDPELYKVTVVTVDRPEALLLKAGMAPLEVKLKTVSERHAFGRLAIAAARLARTGRFDLIHSQGSTAAVASSLSARLYRLPHVVTLHETFRSGQFNGPIGRIRRLVVANALRQASSVIAVTNDARDNLLSHVALDVSTTQRVEVIRNGVAIEALMREADTTPVALRSRLHIGTDVVIFGFLGRFMPEKGFGVLLKAVRHLSSRTELPRFVVVAVNDGAFVREYRQQIARWKLEHLFRFMGLQPSAAETVLGVDCVVMPSLREACGLLAMEAMVLGRSLIVSDCIGLRELTRGSVAIQTVAGNPESLAAGMEEFLTNQHATDAAARAHAKIARLTFDSTETATKLASVFSRVLAGRDPSMSWLGPK